MRDDFDPVVADWFTVLDDVPVPDTWTRVQSKVLNHMPVHFTEREATMIDLETPDQTDEHGKGPKRFAVAGLLAAAAVAAIAVMAIRNDDPVTPADQPSPTVTVPPTVPPRELSGLTDEQFAPGTYYLDKVGGVPTPRIFVTLGDGWINGAEGSVIAGPDGVMAFSRPARVWSDACHAASEGFHPGPVTTLDGLVTALYEQRGWLDVTTPSDVTVNGYPGKEFRRTAPADLTDCNGGRLFSFDGGGGGSSSHYDPGEIETLRVLDLNGTIILINTRLQGDFDAAAAAGLAATLDSIRIEQT